MEKIFFFNQIKNSFRYFDLITHIALKEVKIKYIKTFLGPIWNSLSIMIFIISFGFVGSRLWGLDVEVFLPNFAASYIIWICISNIIGESTTILNANANILKSVNTPILVFHLSMVLKNTSIFFHHVLAFFLISLFFSHDFSFSIIFIIFSVFFFFIIAVLFSFSWSILCNVYSDLVPLTNNLLQLLFFITPIFWPAERLTGTYFKLLVDFNPIYQILNLIKQPLMGNLISMSNVLSCLMLIIFLLLIAILVGNIFRKKIIFFIN